MLDFCCILLEERAREVEAGEMEKQPCWGVGEAVMGLLLLELSGPDPSCSYSPDFEDSCVGKRDSRMEMSLLLQTDTSPRRVPTLASTLYHPVERKGRGMMSSGKS